MGAVELLLPLWAFPLLRFVKLLAVMGLFAGTAGVFLSRHHADAERAAFAVAGPSFGVVWVVGFVLAWARGISTLTPWIVGAIALSLVSINAVLYVAGKDGRRSGTTALVAIVPLVVSLALMVWQPS